MKKTLTIINAIALLQSQSFAQNENNIGQFAVLKPDKACSVKPPEIGSSSPVYFSKDCETAYVLPSTKIKMLVEEPLLLAGSNDNICTAFEEQTKNLMPNSIKIGKIEDEIIKLATEVDKSDLELRIKTLNQLKKDLERKEREVLRPFDDMPAMRAKIVVATDQASQIVAFQKANVTSATLNDGSVYPTRFVPAQIAESVLNISTPDEKKYRGRGVLKVNFPGVVVTSGTMVHPDLTNQYSVSMNGGLSGIVDISASSYCQTKFVLTKKLAEKNKLNGTTNSTSTSIDFKDIFASAIALNMTYNVRAQVGAKLNISAKIATKDLLKSLSEKLTVGIHERHDVTNDLITGGLNNTLKIQIDDMGYKNPSLSDLINNESEDSELSLVASLVAKSINNYISRSEAKLEQLGIFSKEDRAKPKEVKNTSEDVVAGYQNVCRSESKFFGLVRKSVCNSYPVVIKVDHDGISTLVNTLQDDSYVSEAIVYQSNETVLINHTSAFVKNLPVGE